MRAAISFIFRKLQQIYYQCGELNEVSKCC